MAEGILLKPQFPTVSNGMMNMLFWRTGGRSRAKGSEKPSIVFGTNSVLKKSAASHHCWFWGHAFPLASFSLPACPKELMCFRIQKLYQSKKSEQENFRTLICLRPRPSLPHTHVQIKGPRRPKNDRSQFSREAGLYFKVKVLS